MLTQANGIVCKAVSCKHQNNQEVCNHCMAGLDNRYSRCKERKRGTLPKAPFKIEIVVKE